MLKVEQGKRAVWEHAKEAGMGDDITLIAKYFDIKDICIIYNGKMTFIDERPRKCVRIAVAAKPDIELKHLVADKRQSKSRLKR